MDSDAVDTTGQVQAVGGDQDTRDLKGPQRGHDSVNRPQGFEDSYSERRGLAFKGPA